MTEPSQSGQSSVNSPTPEFPFANKPPSSLGPETVVNPERRGIVTSPASAAGSSVWRRLFPTEADEQGATLPTAEGTRIGHFVIQERIGAGGMGAVFRALDERLQRDVALKVLSPAQSRDPSSKQRFLNEARAAARLDDDHIARVFFEGEDEGLNYIAFEYVRGVNVRDQIQQQGRLDPAEAVNYTLQIGTALKHTSAAGVIHRDIKPSNIIITPTGRAKLVDLGLARKESTNSEADLTLAGTTLGTFDYISPEQAKDPRNVDVRSDIYSLGCTLYHMLTGEPPYADGTVLQKLLDHQGGEPPDPREKNGRVPAELAAVVKKMMASDLRRRYSTPELLIRDLMIVAGKLGLQGVPPETLVWTNSRLAEPRFVERHLPWIATVAILLVIVLGLEWWGGPQPNTTGGGHGSDPPLPGRQATAGGPNNAVEPQHQGAGRPSLQPAEKGSSGDGRPTGSETPAATANNSKSSPGDADLPPNIGGTNPTLFEQISSLLQNRLPQESTGGSTRPAAGSQGERNPSTVEPPPAENVALLNDRPVIAPKPQAEPPAEPAILISGYDEPFRTLEAAFRMANNGDVIVLQYNGPAPRPEKPLTVTSKNITVRAADGFRPLIRFQADGLPDETRMITLVDSRLTMINVDVELDVRGGATTDPWALLSMQGSDYVSLHGVAVTVVNDSNEHVAVFELLAGPGQKMNTGMTDEVSRFGVTIRNSLVRGACDLLVSKYARPGRLEAAQSVVALDGSGTNGSLLNVVEGSTEMRSSEMRTRGALELSLEHTTCLLAGNVLRLTKVAGHSVLPVHVTTAANNIIASKNTDDPAAMVLMQGDASSRDFRGLLRWNGQNNFYDGVRTFWLVASTQGSSNAESYRYDEWASHWKNSASFVGSSEAFADTDGVKWTSGWRERPFAGITAADLELVDDALVNPAINGSSDGTPAGADLTDVPQPGNASAGESTVPR